MNRPYVPTDELDALLGTGSGGPDPVSAAWWDRFLAADPGAARAARALLAQLRGTRVGQVRLNRVALTQIQHLLRSIYAYVQRTGDLVPAGAGTSPPASRRAYAPPAPSYRLNAGNR